MTETAEITQLIQSIDMFGSARTVFIGIAIVSFAFSAFMYSSRKDYSEKTMMLSSLRSIGNMIIARQGEDGFFVYDYNIPLNEFDWSRDPSWSVRQAAALYLLGNLYEVTGDWKYLTALKRNVDLYFERSLTTQRDGVILRSFGSDSDPLGTLALVYAGGAMATRADPLWGENHRGELNQVLNTITWLQKGDGDFAQTFRPTLTAEEREKMPSSPYYTGETLVALSYALEIGGIKKIHDSLFRALRNIRARTDGSQDYRGLYLWLMTGLNRLIKNPQFTHEERTFMRNLGIEYQKPITPQLQKLSNVKNNCFAAEGLGYYLRFADASVDTSLEETVFRDRIRESFKFQVMGPVVTDVNGVSYEIPADYQPLTRGAFLSDLTYLGTRIDYAQHCALAYKAYIESVPVVKF